MSATWIAAAAASASADDNNDDDDDDDDYDDECNAYDDERWEEWGQVQVQAASANIDADNNNNNNNNNNNIVFNLHREKCLIYISLISVMKTAHPGFF